jgi:NADH pyrophosphatase NudC (nudix superfamily)
MNLQSAKYCAQCGTRLVSRWILAEDRDRNVCPSCGRISYDSPRVLVICLVECNGLLLLCRRAHAPSSGRWTVPGGFLEGGETLEGAAIRETLEETGVKIDSARLDLHIISSVPWMNEVYVGFRASVTDPRISIGPECLDARFFQENEIPWDDLAFHETAGYLQLALRERGQNRPAIHITRIDQMGGHRREYAIGARSDIFKADIPTSRSTFPSV